MKTKRGTNQYKKKYHETMHWLIKLILIVAATIVLAWIFSYAYDNAPEPQIISPIAEAKENTIKVRFLNETELKEALRKSIPNMVEMSASRFATNDKQKNYVIYQLYCLLRKESDFGENENCGDSGKSCGILHFWEDTYNRMRKQMIKQGLVTELGDRFSPFYSIETTAWALVNGYGREWGPIARRECQ